MTKPGATDDRTTLIAQGCLAYIFETMLHEAVGHGGMCLASGFRVTAVAPLWMHCSTTTPWVNFAGPAANFIGALVYWLVLRMAPSTNPVWNNVRFFIWLSLAYNALVAAGYMAVGGLTGFGDWPAVFAFVQPAWLARAALVAAGAGLYAGSLRLVGHALRRDVLGATVTDARLRWLVLWPALGAAIVACGAEVYGQGAHTLGLALALGCTMGVGLSLTALPTVGAPCATVFRVRFGIAWILAGLVVALGFVAVIGPGYGLL